jgi:hypothetical protein
MNEENKVREEIVEWISKPEDKDLLEILKQIKESSESGDWYKKLTNEEKESVQQGIEDHKKGRTLTSREFWEKHG